MTTPLKSAIQVEMSSPCALETSFLICLFVFKKWHFHLPSKDQGLVGGSSVTKSQDQIHMSNINVSIWVKFSEIESLHQ